MTAEEFFLSIAKPTVEDFLLFSTDIRHGFLAAIVLNQIVDYWDQENGPTDGSAKKIRDKLAGQSPAFAVVRDVADAA